MISKIIIFILLALIKNNIGDRRRNSIRGRIQNRIFSFHVAGRVICKGRPYSNAQIVLVHHFKWRGKTPTIMAGGVTAKSGVFSLTGRMQTFMAMVPFVSIIHNCNQLRNRKCKEITNVRFAPELVFKGHSNSYDKNLNFVDLSRIPVQKIVCERKK
uniref:Transthyretin-like family protein n=1 Tax=Strongyloides venezuelensis TaxID=75913 RepID=A0A0K0EUZ1_STRVS